MDNRTEILKRNKRIATCLMVAAAVLFVVARYNKAAGIWGWVAAFAEAAMVGALADWFAVVALFRHPLGIPVPHTAIIKNKKDAIAGNLAGFIRDKFLASDTLVAKLRAYNPALRLADYLASQKNASVLAKGLTRICSESLDFIDDERVQQFFKAAISSRVESFDAPSSISAVIETLRKDNRHQSVLDDLLNRAALWLDSEEAQTRLAKAIEDLCAKEYPLLVAFIPNRDQFALGAGLKIIKRINAFIQEVNIDPEHEVRNRFDTAIAEFAEQLKTDVMLRNRVEEIKHDFVNNSSITDYAKSIGNDLKNWLHNDLHSTESKVQARIAAAVAGLGATLSNADGLKESLNEHLEKLLIYYGDTIRDTVASHISSTVQSWNSDDYTDEIELNIGSDLQFIRMNGTLVGGVIGLLLHAVALFLM